MALWCSIGGRCACGSLGTEKPQDFSEEEILSFIFFFFVWTFKVFLEKQRLAYIRVAQKSLPIILNMKICQELRAKWICIHQSCAYSRSTGHPEVH